VGALRDVKTPRVSAATVEFDAFSVAVGLAIVAGGLAVVAPYLNSLAAALAALAGAGWAAGRSTERARGAAVLSLGRWTGLLSAGLGTAAFFLLPGPFSVVRGLALGISLLPLWLVERRRAPGPAARLREPP